MLEADVLVKALDHLTDGVLLINTASLQILYVNDTYESITGFSKKDLVGTRSYNFVTGELDTTQEKTVALKVKEWEGGIRDVFFSQRKDGSSYQASLHSFVVPTATANILGIVHRDVTETYEDRQSLASSERLYKAVFDSSYGFTIMCEPSGAVLEVNNGFMEDYQFQRKEEAERLIGNLLWDLYSFRASEKLRQSIKSCFLAEVVTLGMTKRIETSMLRRDNDGSTDVVDLSFKPIRDEDGTIVLVVVEGRDISARLLHEKELTETKKNYETVLREIKTGEITEGKPLVEKSDNLLERVLRVEAEVASVTGDIKQLRQTVFEDPERSINIIKSEVDILKDTLGETTKRLGYLEEALYFTRRFFNLSRGMAEVLKTSRILPWIIALALGTQLFPVLNRIDIEGIQDRVLPKTRVLPPDN